VIAKPTVNSMVFTMEDPDAEIEVRSPNYSVLVVLSLCAIVSTVHPENSLMDKATAAVDLKIHAVKSII
jgi:hypothetical protein